MLFLEKFNPLLNYLFVDIWDKMTKKAAKNVRWKWPEPFSLSFIKKDTSLINQFLNVADL